MRALLLAVVFGACNGGNAVPPRNDPAPVVSVAAVMPSSVPDAAIAPVDASVPDTALDDLRARVLALPLVHTLAALPPAHEPPPPPHTPHDLEPAHPPAPPKLTDRGLGMSDGLPPEIIRRIVRQNFGRFRLCYENAARADPEGMKRATVIVRFAIDSSGNVAMAEPTTDAASPFPSCVARGFASLSFPQPDVPLVAVEYTIGFELTGPLPSRGALL